MRMPLGFIGGLVSNGIAFLLTVIPASPRAFSASLPSIPLLKTSTSIRCVSVPPEMMRKPSSASVSASTFALATTCVRVVLELRLHRLAEADGLGGDDVDQRPALHAGENDFVDGCGELLLWKESFRRADRAESCAWW